MDEENKNNDDYSDFPEALEDTFEIGIPIEDVMNTLQSDADPVVDPVVDPGIDSETEPETEQKPDTQPAEDITEPDFSDEKTTERSPFDELKSEIQSLAQAFETKLKYDAHKNKTIDDLHQSLQDYREGLVKKYVHRIVMDIIKIVDDIRKFTYHHKNQPASDETAEKLLNYTEAIASDLEDLFSWEGIVPFTCDGDIIDLTRQRILHRIRTDDPEKDKTVAERLRPGYEWDGKIIRPEMISAFIYQTESAAEGNNNA